MLKNQIVRGAGTQTTIGQLNKNTNRIIKILKKKLTIIISCRFQVISQILIRSNYTLLGSILSVLNIFYYF